MIRVITYGTYDYRHQGLPDTVLEALSCGLIPILSDIEPHKELVDGTTMKHIFERHSKEELKTMLMESLTWNVAEQSKAARQVAVDCFGIDSLAKKYYDIYNNANI